MKRLFKTLKYILLFFILTVVLALATIFVGHKYLYPIPYSEIQTVEDIREDGFCFGVGCHPEAKTAAEFIPIFAKQIERYNKIAPSLWPDNLVVDIYAVIESIENSNAYLVSPQGDITELNRKELKALVPVRQPYDVGFAPFENDSIKGVYLALSEESLKNVLTYEKYQHLGTYDLFITYVHEMFHIAEQDKKWSSPDEIINRAKNERLDDIEARIIRNQLLQKLVDAVVATDAASRDSLILQALSIYKKYKNECTADYESSLYFDRVEGTAYYYELISCLYVAYPKQVFSHESLNNALTILAKHFNPYQEVGLVTSAYYIGAWASVLLDRIDRGEGEWKNEIIENPNSTPLSILEQRYEDFDLIDLEPVTNELREKVLLAIEEEKNIDVKPNIFRFLYQLIF